MSSASLKAPPARRIGPPERFASQPRALVAAVLAVAGWACGPSSSGKPPGVEPLTRRSTPITLTILHTNDTHSRLEPSPSGKDLNEKSPGPQQGGVARRKTLIDRVRAEREHVLLVDSGDRAQGTIFFNAWQGSAEIMAVNALGYDAVSLGNHEFDLGSIALGRALRGEPVAIAGVPRETEALRAPLVATNVDGTAEPALADLLVKRTVLERGGERIGVLGVVTKDTEIISSPGTGVRFVDELASVQAEADALRALGVDKVVLLSHSGYALDVERAARWTGIDVIVSAHDHALLGEAAQVDAVAPGQGKFVRGPYPTVVTAADGEPTLVVSAFEQGAWLGELEVSFDSAGRKTRWEARPTFVRGCAFADGGVDCTGEVAPEDPAVKAAVDAYRAPVAEFAGAVVGETAVAFDGSRVPGLRTQEMALGNLVADVMLVAGAGSDGAVAALMNGGGVRAGLRAGRVTYEDALAVLPFGNRLMVVALTGEELLAALDLGLSKSGQGAFPQVAGLRLTYCGAEPCAAPLRPGGRVVSLAVAGTPVERDRLYRVATNDYLAGGGDGQTAIAEACKRPGGYCRDTGLLQLDLLIDELRLRSPVSRSVEGRIVAQ